MFYRGGCHCGNVSFEVEGTCEIAVSCNCSICSKKGALLWAVPRDRVKVRAAVEPGRYLFNKHAIAHRFCTICGMHPYAEDNQGDGPSAYINLRCIDELDVTAVPTMHFDGRAAP